MFRITVQLQPRASRTGITGRHGDAIKAQVQAAAVDGAANAALVELLAEAFQVPRRSIRLLHGQTSRRKVLEIEAEAAACADRLEEILAARAR